MAEQGFTLTSPAFTADGAIPTTFTCDGEDRSPELNWMHPPDGARSFALIVDDLLLIAAVLAINAFVYRWTWPRLNRKEHEANQPLTQRSG